MRLFYFLSPFSGFLDPTNQEDPSVDPICPEHYEAYLPLIILFDPAQEPIRWFNLYWNN